MKRLLQWQNVVPRVLLVIVLLLTAQYVLGVVARSVAIQQGETTLGASVDVGHARVSFVNRQVVLNDVRIANTQRPAKSYLEANRCELSFSPGAALHKQTVVENGRISGLRFGADTERESGARRTAGAWFNDNADAVARKWLEKVNESFSLEAVNRLESVERTEKFSANWSKQSATFDERLQDLDRRAAELQAAIEAGQANPLRNDKLLADLPKKAADLQSDFNAFRAEIEKLPDQLETERRAIIAARRNDVQGINNQLQLDGVDTSAFSAYLLREQAAKQLNELLGWVRWAREVMPGEAKQSANPGRGENVLFAGCRRKPGLLVRSLELRGAAKIGGQPVEWRGTLSNLALSPRLHDQPVRLHLIAGGSLPFELQATIDRTKPIAKDELLVDCQGVLLPGVALGHSDQFELNMGPSVGSLSVSLMVDGDRLSGDVQLVQQKVQLAPGASSARNLVLAGAMGESLGRINSMATRLTLGGTLEQPTCALWSNLGTACAEAMKRGFQRASGQHSKTLLVEAGRHVDERLAEIDRQIAEKQTRFASKSTEINARLQKIAAGESPRYRISAEKVHRLPNNSLFR
jgi:uncharacterized protein (TIGR03545 family)